MKPIGQVSLVKTAATLFLLFGLTATSTNAGPEHEVRAAAVGSKVPAVKVLNTDNKSIELDSLLKQQKTVLVFYRGGW